MLEFVYCSEFYRSQQKSQKPVVWDASIDCYVTYTITINQLSIYQEGWGGVGVFTGTTIFLVNSCFF